MWDMSALNYRPFPHLLLPSFLPLPNFLSKNQGLSLKLIWFYLPSLSLSPSSPPPSVQVPDQHRRHRGRLQISLPNGRGLPHSQAGLSVLRALLPPPPTLGPLCPSQERSQRHCWEIAVGTGSRWWGILPSYVAATIWRKQNLGCPILTVIIEDGLHCTLQL